MTADHPHHDIGLQQPRRRRLQIGDLEKSGRQSGVVARGHVQLADVPVDEAQTSKVVRIYTLNLIERMARRDVRPYPRPVTRGHSAKRMDGSALRRCK